MSQQALVSSTLLAESDELLIRTKFAIPQRRIPLVPRPRLLHLSREGITRGLTLICAPAGYGKTTLVTEWFASLAADEEAIDSTVCWLSLDEGDNDPNRFLNYLIASSAKTNGEIKNKVGALLRAFPPPAFQSILSVLINEPLEENQTLILVLDACGPGCDPEQSCLRGSLCVLQARTPEDQTTSQSFALRAHLYLKAIGVAFDELQVLKAA